MRADHLGCYGYVDAETPELDGLAERGVVFERCIAVAPITLPAHTSILTGLYPFSHGVRSNGTHYLPDDVSTLAEILAPSGFDTGAVVSAFVLDSRFGLDQGFDTYDDDLSESGRPASGSFRETVATDTVHRARRWLEDRDDARWFLWIHFFDPHAEYRAPGSFAERHPHRPYDAEIAFADSALGEVLAVLEERGELGRTLVVATSDHGESLGEHRESGHGAFIYDATTHVPLILSHPELAQGIRIADVVSQVDVVPTVLQLLGISHPGRLDGRPILPVAPLEGVPAYSEAMLGRYNHGWSELRAWRDGKMRYIRAPRPELYDLTRDPSELDDLYAQAGALGPSYERRLSAWLPEDEKDARWGEVSELDSEARASLSALGYVFTNDEEVGATSDRPDPKDKIDHLERFLTANSLIAGERYQEAESILRALLEVDAGWAVRENLSVALQKMGRWEEALEQLRGAVSQPTAEGRVALVLARLEHKLGLESWSSSLSMAKERSPGDPEPWSVEGNWALAKGDMAAASVAYRKALSLDEQHAPAWLGNGVIAFLRGDRPAAGVALSRAVELDPFLADGWFRLGVWHQAEGRPDEAKKSYRTAAELDPNLVTTWIHLAGLQLANAELADAETSLQSALASDPESFDANQALGELRMLQDRPTAAAARFLRASSVRPTSRRAWFGRMTACEAAADLAATREAATRLLELDPGNLVALCTAAVAHDALGHADEAEALAHQAIELDVARVEEQAEKSPGLARILDRLR